MHVAHLLWRLIAILLCSLLYFETMLVSAYREEHFVLFNLSVISGSCVTEHCRVEMADVRLGVDVENWRHHTSIKLC